jgi:translation initiation factor IF-3
VRLVGPAGEQVGIVAIGDALRLAQEADLDLVEVAPMARPPVAKLMDYGKFKYESALKARESRKNQAQTVIKEIKLRPKIDPHDYGTKKGHVERFLKQGDKVKVTIMFRGREQSRPELGYKLLQRLAGDIEELGFVESSPKQDGRNMIMVIGPHKRKTEAMAAAKAERASRTNTRTTTAPLEPDTLEPDTEADVAAEAAPAPQSARPAAQPQPDRPAAQPDRPVAQPQPDRAAAQPQSARPAAEPQSARPAAEQQSARPAAQPQPDRPAAQPDRAAAQPQSARPAARQHVRQEPGTAGATPRPAPPRSAAGSAPRPTPRPAPSANGPRPAPPRPAAPRGTAGAARTASPGPAGTAAKPAPAGDSSPAPRTRASTRAASGPAGSGEADTA